jgi:hypothetical protein
MPPLCSLHAPRVFAIAQGLTFMAMDETTERLFKALPPPSLQHEFKDHIRRTSRPEDFPGLSWTEPPFKLAGSHIVCRFQIDGSKRASEHYIPCANCGNQPKFLDGALIWSPDHRIRLIGHCCAAATSGDTYQKMLNEHEEKEQTERNVEFLLSHLSLIPSMILEIARMEQICSNIRTYRNQFKVHLGPLYSAIRKAGKDGSKLSVSIPVARGDIQRGGL